MEQFENLLMFFFKIFMNGYGSNMVKVTTIDIILFDTLEPCLIHILTVGQLAL